MALRVLEGAGGERLRPVCEAIVPGSGAVGPEVYVDALLAGMADGERGEALADIETVCAAHERGELSGFAGGAPFARVRALAIEAYYSDFVAPGAQGPGAWRRIGFEFPLADRVSKDWSYLGIDDE